MQGMILFSKPGVILMHEGCVKQAEKSGGQRSLQKRMAISMAFVAVLLKKLKSLGCRSTGQMHHRSEELV